MKSKYLLFIVSLLTLVLFSSFSCSHNSKKEISTVDDFEKIDSNSKLILINDIDFENKTISPFSCKSIEGNNHTIKNFSITCSDSICGLFTSISTVSDLTIQNGRLVSNDCKKNGVLAAQISGSVNNVVIKNCLLTINSKKEVSDYEVGNGFIAGYTGNASFNNCIVDNCIVTLNNSKGYGELSFAGICSGKISSITNTVVRNCKFNGKSTSGESVGMYGLAVDVSEEMTNCGSISNTFEFDIAGIDLPIQETKGAKCSLLANVANSVAKCVAINNSVKAIAYYQFTIAGAVNNVNNMNDCLVKGNKIIAQEKGKNGANKSVISLLCNTVNENIKRSIAYHNDILVSTINKKETVCGFSNTDVGTIYKCAAIRNAITAYEYYFFNGNNPKIVDSLCDLEDLGHGLFIGYYELLDLNSDIWEIKENDISIKGELFE